MEEKLRETEDGRQRIQRSEARIDKRLAEHIEKKEEKRGDQSAKSKAEGGPRSFRRKGLGKQRKDTHEGR